jgi:hypothetical protein
LLRRFSLFLLIAFAVPHLLAGQLDGKISGTVLDKDGMTPMQGAMVTVTNWITTPDGVAHIREKLTMRTGRNGTYASSGLYTGRITVSLAISGQTVMTIGDLPGEELYLKSGSEAVVNFDLSKAPPSRQ